jgi:fatty-acyl-CoA synthase
MLHGDVLGERARLNPDRTALVFVPTGARFTYAELDARALRTARALRGLGVSPGDRVAILAHNRPEFLDVFFASGKSGHVCLPLGTRLTPVELAAVLRDAGARVLVHDGALADTVAGLRALGDLPVEHFVALDGDGPSTLSKRVATHAEDDRPFARPRPEDLYALLYTSGTTGRPKGVMLPHRMIAFNAFTTAVGGTVVLHTGFDAAEVFRTLAAEGCTVALGVPTIFKLMLEHPGFATADFSRIRWFISGGAPLPAFVIEAFQRRGVGFKQGFGMTEVGVNCFAMTLEDSVRQAGSIGRPLPFTEARLVDATGAEVPVGEVGELWLRGPHVCLGYWNDRSATAAALDADGFFHTGDLARRNAEGFYTIAGRRKDMFISGGVNVYPAEIEGALLLHPAVQDAAIAGVPHPTWGEVGVAFVVLRPGLTATPGELESFLAASLARFKLPRRYVFRDALPRTPYGKVVKAELVASLSGA